MRIAVDAMGGDQAPRVVVEGAVAAAAESRNTVVLVGQRDRIEAELGLTGSEEETAAIARMQAMQRGKMSRKEIEEQKAAAAKIQAIQRGKQSRREVASMRNTTG